MLPSSIGEYDRTESRERIITHINSPLDDKGREQRGICNIWLKTYGLSSFMVECKIRDINRVIKQLKLDKSIAEWKNNFLI
jgi:hypothetical protein